jgi:hypothetical protein
MPTAWNNQHNFRNIPDILIQLYMDYQEGLIGLINIQPPLNQMRNYIVLFKSID